MPEGPELFKAARFLNKIGSAHVFSAVRLLYPASAKHPAIPWSGDRNFRLTAKSRGKEIRISLVEEVPRDTRTTKKPEILNILLTFGMTGRFTFTPTPDLPKYSMLMFDAVLSPQYTFAFVDPRHFGRWTITDGWSGSEKRGPDIITEYEAFRDNVIGSLEKSVFDKSICEVMLDQRYFSSVGNYLRAEVLYKLDINPFARARDVLQHLADVKNTEEGVNNGTRMIEKENLNESQTGKEVVKIEGSIGTSEDKKDFIKTEHESTIEGNENGIKKEMGSGDDEKDLKTGCDLLEMCHRLCWEVINLPGSGKPYDPEGIYGDWDAFDNWLQCYMKPNMGNSIDGKGRTIWHDVKYGKGRKRRHGIQSDLTESSDVVGDIKESSKRTRSTGTKKDGLAVKEEHAKEVKHRLKGKRKARDTPEKEGRGKRRKAKQEIGKTTSPYFEADEKNSESVYFTSSGRRVKRPS